MKIRLRETVPGLGIDGEIVDVPGEDADWFVLRGWADPLDEQSPEPIGEPPAEKRETAISAQAVRRTRRKTSK